MVLPHVCPPSAFSQLRGQFIFWPQVTRIFEEDCCCPQHYGTHPLYFLHVLIVISWYHGWFFKKVENEHMLREEEKERGLHWHMQRCWGLDSIPGVGCCSWLLGRVSMSPPHPMPACRCTGKTKMGASFRQEGRGSGLMMTTIWSLKNGLEMGGKKWKLMEALCMRKKITRNQFPEKDQDRSSFRRTGENREAKNKTKWILKVENCMWKSGDNPKQCGTKTNKQKCWKSPSLEIPTIYSMPFPVPNAEVFPNYILFFLLPEVFPLPKSKERDYRFFLKNLPQ